MAPPPLGREEGVWSCVSLSTLVPSDGCCIAPAPAPAPAPPPAPAPAPVFGVAADKGSSVVIPTPAPRTPPPTLACCCRCDGMALAISRPPTRGVLPVPSIPSSADVSVLALTTEEPLSPPIRAPIAATPSAAAPPPEPVLLTLSPEPPGVGCVPPRGLAALE